MSKSPRDKRIIELLNDTGHLQHPFGKTSSGPWPSEELEKLQLKDKPVVSAIQSYQTMHAAVLEPLIAKHHPSRPTPVVEPDGDIGPATEELFSLARCSVPDYAFAEAEEAGTGNWRGCHGIGNFHKCKVRFVNSPPSFLAPVMDRVWERVVASYKEVGLLFEKDNETPNYNTTVEFVTPNGNWIGLAIVGSGSLSCSSKIWSRYDKNYRPADIVSEWTTLIKHELGHNCGLQHSNGGVMNPYILKGLPISWKGDPSWPLLVQRFGGVPIPDTEGPKSFDMVIGRLYSDGTFERVMTLRPEDIKGPFPS